VLIPGLSRKHIFEAVEASLKRLDTDYIDVLQIHRYDYDTPREETMKALHGAARSVIVLIVDLVEMGKVRYIGASSIFAYQFIGLQNVADKNGWTKFISMQNQYSLLYREEEREMIPACKEWGVGYDTPNWSADPKVYPLVASCGWNSRSTSRPGNGSIFRWFRQRNVGIEGIRSFWKGHRQSC